MNINIKLISKQKLLMVTVLCFAFVFTASAAFASLTFSSNTITNDSGAITIGGGLASDVTRTTGATGSFQTLAGDVTYQGAAGGTASFHAGMMGHFHGSVLTNNATGYHAGVIGGYSVTTSDALTGPKAGVIGTIGVDGNASTAADAAVMAVLDGGDPGAVITANAAYGVQYLNATTSAKFGYGLDLSHAAVTPYPAVTYSTADIRLQNGETINNSPDGVVAVSGGIKIPKDAASATNATIGTTPTGITCAAATLGTLTWVDDTDTAGAWVWLCEQTGSSTYAWKQLGI